MFTAADRKITGVAALLSSVLSLVMIPLYFVYSGPPPSGNVLARALVTVLTLATFLVFVTGARRMLGPRRRAGRRRRRRGRSDVRRHDPGGRIAGGRRGAAVPGRVEGPDDRRPAGQRDGPAARPDRSVS